VAKGYVYKAEGLGLYLNCTIQGRSCHDDIRTGVVGLENIRWIFLAMGQFARRARIVRW
jgi:hypothetical protein